MLQRTIAGLHSAGIQTVSVVSEDGLGQSFIADALMRQARKGFKNVFLVTLGAYAEVEYAEMLKFHQEAGAAVTRLCDSEGPLDLWILDAAPSTHNRPNFRSDSEIDLNSPLLYFTHGYVNRLTDAHAIRSLAVDAFLGRCCMRPSGNETAPGIWMDEGARVHRSARIVGPVYIGRGVRVRSSALITSLSTLEQCSVVDRGAIVDDSSILPYTYVGKGLDVAHAVVDGNRLTHLRSDVAVMIDDPKMIRRVTSGWHTFRYGDKKAEVVGSTLQRMAPLSTARNIFEETYDKCQSIVVKSSA